MRDRVDGCELTPLSSVLYSVWVCGLLAAATWILLTKPRDAAATVSHCYEVHVTGSCDARR
jgi:hypothetical protein